MRGPSPGLACLRCNVVATWCTIDAGGPWAQDWALLNRFQAACCTQLHVLTINRQKVKITLPVGPSHCARHRLGRVQLQVDTRSFKGRPPSLQPGLLALRSRGGCRALPNVGRWVTRAVLRWPFLQSSIEDASLLVHKSVLTLGSAQLVLNAEISAGATPLNEELRFFTVLARTISPLPPKNACPTCFS